MQNIREISYSWKQNKIFYFGATGIYYHWNTHNDFFID